MTVKEGKKPRRPGIYDRGESKGRSRCANRSGKIPLTIRKGTPEEGRLTRQIRTLEVSWDGEGHVSGTSRKRGAKNFGKKRISGGKNLQKREREYEITWCRARGAGQGGRGHVTGTLVMPKVGAKKGKQEGKPRHHEMHGITRAKGERRRENKRVVYWKIA